MLGFAKGITNSSALARMAIMKSMGRISAPGIMSAPAQMSALPVSHSNSLSFGDVYLGNNMEWEVFKARVQKVLTES
jgi:hypothetical protein